MASVQKCGSLITVNGTANIVYNISHSTPEDGCSFPLKAAQDNQNIVLSSLTLSVSEMREEKNPCENTTHVDVTEGLDGKGALQRRVCSGGFGHHYEPYASKSMHIHLHVPSDVTSGQLFATYSVDTPGSGTRRVRVKTPDSPGGFVIGGTLAVIAIAILVLVPAAWHCRRMRRRRDLVLALAKREFADGDVANLVPELGITEQAINLPYDNAFEIKDEQLELGGILGEGAFGIVLKAEAHGIVAGEGVTTVAVKMVNTHRKSITALKALASELKIMVHLGQHLNVVNLLGACTQDLTNPLVVVEYCRHGNLRSYLKKRTDFIDEIDPETGVYLPTRDLSQSENHRDCCTSDLFRYAFQAAKGMEYLTSRNVIHGDLAARNVLLADDNIVKICDFGLSKIVQLDPDENKSEESISLPIKWMAVESIRNGTFSRESDVWSYGVFLWELFSLAKSPYQDITPTTLLPKLEGGHRLQQPRYATSTIYKVMTDCWQADPCLRPTFTQLAETLSPMINEADHLLYAQKNGLYVEMNRSRQNEPGYNDYLQMFSCNYTLLTPAYANSSVWEENKAVSSEVAATATVSLQELKSFK